MPLPAATESVLNIVPCRAVPCLRLQPSENPVEARAHGAVVGAGVLRNSKIGLTVRLPGFRVHEQHLCIARHLICRHTVVPVYSGICCSAIAAAVTLGYSVI